MKKHKLGLEDDFDFDLIGIICPQSDYRICWAINERLNILLKKSDEPFLVSGKKNEIVSSHSFYEWYDEIEDVDYFLVKNKDHAQFLIPEKKQIDYFLAIKESGVVDANNLMNKIKEIDAVMMAYLLIPEELKSGHRLIFE